MSLKSPNPDLNPESDHLHHFNLPDDRIGYDYFSDVRFVLCGGSSQRMTGMAKYAHGELKAGFTSCKELVDLSKTSRFVLFKLGPILFVSHGMGNSSLSIMLNEIIKLLYYAKCQDVVLIRCGTCGGIGTEAGSLIITTEGLNGNLKPEFTQCVLGDAVTTSTALSEDLADDLFESAKGLNIAATKGKTLAADGFYEEQARKNGLFCTYSQADSDAFITKIHDLGVRNIEMEATCLASLCSRAGVKAGVICVALLNRLKTDVVKCTQEQFKHWESLPGKVVIDYIKRHL